jgi:hypothetical protein
MVRTYKIYLELIVAILALFGTAWALAPSLDLRPGVVTSKSNPTNADFTISNVGRVPVYGVILTCRIKTREVHDLFVGANAGKSPLGGHAGQGISILHANESVTRNCAAGFPTQIPLINVTYPASFTITVDYSWPFIGYRDSITRAFGSRTADDGSVTLAPDTGW